MRVCPVVRVQCKCALIRNLKLCLGPVDEAWVGVGVPVTFCHAPSIGSCSVTQVGGCSPPTKEVGCVECHHEPFGVDQAVLYYWHCLWISGGQSKFVGEWASLRNRMVLLWVCSGPSLPVHTSSSSCHTPAEDVTEWEWLVIFYLVGVFHVVYNAVQLKVVGPSSV